ncbi:alpha/beta hydrolase fold [Bacteroides luti]|uniref:Alpha/beta hydrolase fold n=2 Tax=Bacteroides luti TaxID=1297750 RepID=A0A1M5BAN0_9BACE|nr:alpha/beta hydrolase fold [Bacteroides luti]
MQNKEHSCSVNTIGKIYSQKFDLKMKSFNRLSLAIILFITVSVFSKGAESSVNVKRAARTNYVSLDGQSLPKGNAIGKDGEIHKVDVPLLHLVRTKSGLHKGTVLLIPGGDYETLKLKSECESTTRFLNAQNFDVAVLEYRVGSDIQTRNMALTDALKAFRLLKGNKNLQGLNTDHLLAMGFASGGHLAAKAVQRMNKKEQPDELILISPSYMNETLAGTVYAAVLPPLEPVGRLLTIVPDNGDKAWVKSCEEYTKTWIGYDGKASCYSQKDNVYVCGKDTIALDGNFKLSGILKKFLEAKPETEKTAQNPATVPVEGYNHKRHADKLALVAKDKYDLIMIGNSITNNFEKPQYQSVWNQFFAPRKALNLGFSGYRTENLIWNIQNGELEGQSPKVVVLEIGTNNIDEVHYPTRHTAGQLAGGIEAVVKLLREKLPDSKIIMMRCFPGCYGGPNPTSHRMILERASDLVSRIADGKHVFYCDVNHVFLNMNGSINHDMMSDWLHPSPAGAKAWAQAMEPLLSELMGDKSLDTEISSNTAIVPASKLENDSYDWWARHADVLAIKDSINPEVVLIGNSITHFWGGLPQLKYADGRLRTPNGAETWNALFKDYRVLNLGFGWDRTQNVLWRLDHGEIDRLHPRTIILHIGTNNTSETKNARMNTAPEIVEGIRAICMRLRSKVPGAKIVLMSVFPREHEPTHPRRILINEINRNLETFAKENNITLLNIGPKMLEADGTLPKEIAPDFCHPTEKGYQIWADVIRPLISKP